MLVWKYFILGAIFAGAVALYVYLRSEEKKGERINKLTCSIAFDICERRLIKLDLVPPISILLIIKRYCLSNFIIRSLL